MGKDTVIVADSIVLKHKEHLDRTAKIFEQKSCKVIRVANAPNPEPEPVYTYTNTLIVGSKVFVPMYAILYLEEHVYGGAIHCLTKQ